MQKKLLTLAVAGALAVPVAALADVTVYGTIDGGLRQQSKALIGVGQTESNLVVTDGLRTTNRFGLRGSEDLGGGLMANFTLEGQYSSDTGTGPATSTNTTCAVSATCPTGVATATSTGLFQRKAVVGLSKGGMSIDVGRDYTVNFKAQGIYDPMSYTYTGIAPNVLNTAGVRFNNLVTAGFRFGTGGIRVDYTTGGQQNPDGTPGNDTGDGIGVNGDFAFGPVTIAAAFSSYDANAAGQSVDTMNIGVRYNMGAFTFRAGFSDTDTESADTKTPMLMVGVQYAFSPTLNGRVGFYSHETDVAGVTGQERKQLLVSLDYYLSKRTTAYLLLDRLELNSGTVNLSGAQSGPLADGATGISVGLAHSF